MLSRRQPSTGQLCYASCKPGYREIGLPLFLVCHPDGNLRVDRGMEVYNRTEFQTTPSCRARECDYDQLRPFHNNFGAHHGSLHVESNAAHVLLESYN